MVEAKLQQVNAAVNSFLRKSSKRNEPLEAFRETDAFKSFEKAFREGIQAQADWLAKNLHEIVGIDDQITVDNDTVIEMRLTHYINENMPAISAYVTENQVYDYFIGAFIYSIQSSLLRLGYRMKSAAVPFELKNKFYLSKLKDQANYLLNRSSIDDTTKQQMINLIQDAKIIDNATVDEMGSMLSSQFEEISERRGFVIANTETNQAMSTADVAFMRENDVPTKVWVAAGGNTCVICNDNASQGAIGTNEEFDSGDDAPPAHPNCECYIEAGEIDLQSINIWDGS